MPRLTLTEYATLSVRLAASDRPAADLLADAHLSAMEWEEETAHWEDQLSDAIEREDEVPQLLLQYSEAVQLAQQSLTRAPVPLPVFCRILGELRSAVPLDQALRCRQISLQDFLSAQQVWLQRAASDPEVRRALEETLP